LIFVTHFLLNAGHQFAQGRRLPGVVEAREQDRADAVHRRRRIHRLLAVFLCRLPDYAVLAGGHHTVHNDEVAHVVG